MMVDARRHRDEYRDISFSATLGWLANSRLSPRYNIESSLDAVVNVAGDVIVRGLRFSVAAATVAGKQLRPNWRVKKAGLSNHPESHLTTRWWSYIIDKRGVRFRSGRMKTGTEPRRRCWNVWELCARNVHHYILFINIIIQYVFNTYLLYIYT